MKCGSLSSCCTDTLDSKFQESKGDPKVLRRLILPCLIFALAGSANAQLAPNAPKDNPQGFRDGQIEAMRIAIAPYVAKGRATYPGAKKRYLSGLPLGQTFYILTTLSESHRFEQVFVRVTSIKEGVVTGLLSSDIEELRGYRKGQLISVPESDILDWLISYPDGSEEGNVVGKFMDSYHQANG
jgi:hypothetical protein